MKKHIALTLTITCFCLLAHAQTRVTLKAAQKNINGTWVSTQNKTWKLVILNSQCIQYYGASVQERDNLNIATTIPTCGLSDVVTPGAVYLQLIDIKNPKDNHTCYQIISLTETELAIHPFKSKGNFVFTRQ